MKITFPQQYLSLFLILMVAILAGSRRNQCSFDLHFSDAEHCFSTYLRATWNFDFEDHISNSFEYLQIG